MGPLTRRRLLHGTTALLAALAGCGGQSTTSHSSSHRRFENVEKHPDQFAIRVADDDRSDNRLVWRRETDTGAGADADPRGYFSRNLVASERTARSLVFADVDGKANAERFVADTDFATETLYLEPNRVEQCFELELCYVSWSATSIETQYGRHYRDADVECSADVYDTLLRLIRIPDTLDPDAVTSHGSGSGSGGCRYPPSLRTTRETTTWAETADSSESTSTAGTSGTTRRNATRTTEASATRTAETNATSSTTGTEESR